MNGTAHLFAEDAVDQLVLLDSAEAVELTGHDLRAEVVASAGEVLYPHVGPGQGRLDPLLELVCARHP